MEISKPANPIILIQTLLCKGPEGKRILKPLLVTPAKAGVQKIPAKYQIASYEALLDSGESRNDGLRSPIN